MRSFGCHDDLSGRKRIHVQLYDQRISRTDRCARFAIYFRELFNTHRHGLLKFFVRRSRVIVLFFSLCVRACSFCLLFIFLFIFLSSLYNRSPIKFHDLHHWLTIIRYSTRSAYSTVLVWIFVLFFFVLFLFLNFDERQGNVFFLHNR